ncbi:hypothetical protein Clacol_003090 [Clathrus columnatus]|uniref:Mediator of RNA polymerase II transcription subunit 5 n=1 Tax=Clathrus columnatus TaxID=1419009 RepID=A0AAV5A7C0_9AGAM|nr:hypothetical protein Clacol_003090 [Clathrus columnatus]
MALEPGFEANHSESVVQSAIAQVFTHHDLLDQIEFKIRSSASMSASMSSSDSVTEDDSKFGSGTVRYELLASLISAGLLDHKFAIELMVNAPPNVQTRISMYLQESGSDVDTFIDSKFSADVSFDDIQTFVHRVMRDLHSHAPFTSLLHSNHDIERLGQMCKALTEHESLLEVLTLHTPLYDMIAHSLACLDEFDLTTIHSSVFNIGSRNFSADQIRTCSIIYPPDSLSQENKFILEAWRKAIFDPSREGIDDDILRSTKPQVLLSLSATLFSEAIDACISKKMDAEALQNGLSYYMSPLLNWTLVGIVQALLDEVERRSFQSPQHIKTLEEILSHKDCPSTVLRITRQQILRLYSDPKAQAHTPTPNMTALVSNVLKVPPPTSQNIKEPGAWLHEPRTLIRHALALASTGKVPTIDISRCLSMTNVRTFFDFTWREMLAAADMGGIELCRRFATIMFAPTSGTSMESATPSVPPLLPLFLHAYVPSLLVYIDGQSPNDQNLSVQLLAAIVVSALTFAAHFEKALVGMNSGLSENVGGGGGGGGNKTSLPCSAIARKLRIDLRRLKGPSALALFQKLSASSTFISTFPSL